jgi:transposase
MLNCSGSVRIFLATNPVDMRRQIDGLAALVNDVLSQDPFTGHVFVFRGRRADRVKILVWDKNGFVLYYKRLEKGRFRFPDATSPCRELDSTGLTLLLEGLDLELASRAPRWHPVRGTSSCQVAASDRA